MTRAIFSMLFLMMSFPAMAGQVAECYATGGHHGWERISAARYVRLYGSHMLLTGRTGKRDMPRWSLRCGPIADGIYCSRRTGKAFVEVWTDGWRMTERVSHRTLTDEITHVVYNCNNELVLP